LATKSVIFLVLSLSQGVLLGNLDPSSDNQVEAGLYLWIEEQHGIFLILSNGGTLSPNYTDTEQAQMQIDILKNINFPFPLSL
jgi:hypothetical protein